MLNKTNIIIYSILILLLLIMGYLAFQNKEQKIYIKKIDTLFVNLPVKRDTIKIKAKAKIRYRNIKDTLFINDTIFYKTPAFTARLDTIIKDTINIKYYFPENEFSFLLRPRPDTVKFKYVKIKTEVIKKDKWYIKPVYIVGGFLLGYLVNDLKR